MGWGRTCGYCRAAGSGVGGHTKVLLLPSGGVGGLLSGVDGGRDAPTLLALWPFSVCRGGR